LLTVNALDQIIIYRMTHIRNIPHVLEKGITHKNSRNANPNFINIGDGSLINSRAHKVVKVDNGDYNNILAPNIILGNFIPFYFGVRMPMLYVIQNGGNFVEKPTPAEQIVYIACSLVKTVASKITYFFSDGHATDRLTSFYDETKIQDLPKIIDWHAIKAQYWSGNDNLNVKRKKQAEFLVGGDLLPETINGFGCYNEKAKEQLIEMGINEKIIKIIPGAYY
jgi:hypothetical protein